MPENFLVLPHDQPHPSTQVDQLDNKIPGDSTQPALDPDASSQQDHSSQVVLPRKDNSTQPLKSQGVSPQYKPKTGITYNINIFYNSKDNYNIDNPSAFKTILERSKPLAILRNLELKRPIDFKESIGGTNQPLLTRGDYEYDERQSRPLQGRNAQALAKSKKNPVGGRLSQWAKSHGTVF